MDTNVLIFLYVAFFVAFVIAVLVIPELIRKHNKKSLVLPEKFRSYTGSAEGRIIESHWESYLVSGVRSGAYMKEDQMDDSESVYIVTYEFEVEGTTYTGKGEGSPALQARKTQQICYDPSNPNRNCTLYYLNDQKYNPKGSMVGKIIKILFLAGIAWYIASKLL